MTVTVERAGSDEETFVEVYGLLLELHKQGAFAPLDNERASANTFNVIAEGHVFVARVDGKAVGTIGLVEFPFWYSTETYLQESWFYVSPEYRAGEAGKELMRAAREEGERMEKIVLVTITDPDRMAKKVARGNIEVIHGFVPAGYTHRLR